MNLRYNGTDITDSVNIIDASVTDRCGGKSDSMDIMFSDTKKLWRQWNPAKGDILEVSQDGFSSGAMYIDEFEVFNGKYNIKSKSIPINSRTKKTNGWENIRFKQIMSQLSSEVGLQLKTYGIEDHLYDRMDMINRTNLEFMNERCILEGYSLKITDKKAIIYSEKALENYAPVKEISEDSLIGNYKFKTISSGIYSSCLVEYFASNNIIKYKFDPKNPPIGDVLKVNLRANNIGEAERYSKNLLRYNNKMETVGAFSIKQDSTLAAGNTIAIKDIGSFSGKYFIYLINHNFTNGKSYLKARRVLEDY
ncbi:phage late control D family protein [Clostridium tyrobutyricum]|uniref:phage late control D family protein n=1 Tax=Clostridium tyrobutyricum TaxID=1519 RepID=UPI00073D3560|nr:phage late control D family protein [Clostridium tyrobutyricum]